MKKYKVSKKPFVLFGIIFMFLFLLGNGYIHKIINLYLDVIRQIEILQQLI